MQGVPTKNLSDIPISSLLKRSALIFIPIAFTLTSILFLGVNVDEKLQINRNKFQEANRIELVKERVTRDLSVVDTDLRVIVNMPLFQEYVNSGNPLLKTKIEDFFLNFSRETKRYDQMRYLDTDGHEVFRVNYNNGYPAIVPSNKLQNKRERYYFIDTIKLNKDEIFVSPLDLNMELGKLERPFKPVIRYGTPVFDNNNNKKGIILLNYLGSKLLRIFREEKQALYSTMLLNRDGYWLSGPNHEDEWGFMLGKENQTFGHDYPDVWQVVSSSKQGTLLTEEGLFVFTTAYHLSNWQDSTLNSVTMDDHYWKIVSFIPHTALSVNTIYNQPLSKVLLGVIYLLLGLASISVARIILNRKQVEMALRNSSARIIAILNAVSEGIYSIDINGNIMIENPASIRILGWDNEEIIGQPAHKIIHQTRADGSPYLSCECPIYATLNDEIPRQVDDELFRCKDGTNIPVSYAARVMRDSERNVIGVIVSFRNITEQKQAKQLLLSAKNKAEMANRAKDSFLATMSHEIRTPLTGMLGMLEVLSMAPLKKDQVETLQAAWDSARNLLRIVNDILDWSKIEEGKLEISPCSTFIPQLLQEVVNTYSRAASIKSLMIKQYSDERLSSAHLVDPLRLSQVLNNFVSNAIKFTQKGEIELTAELIEVHESGERIRFSVRDTGIGISKNNQKYLFERYRQESSDTARMYGGTGLGLAICQRLADMLDGEILLESEPEQGATFSITLVLPVSGEPAEKITCLHPEVSQRAVEPLFSKNINTPLVLTVDDHPINRDLLARQVKLLGLRAESAENGKVALSMWLEGRFDLVITDCHMPEMDGYAFSLEVRKKEAENNLPRTPIIAWTANALSEETKNCLAAGMDDLLVKPANLIQLKQMLSKWLSIDEMNHNQCPSTSNYATNSRISTPIDYTVLQQIESDSGKQLQILQDFILHIRTDYEELLLMLEQEEQKNIKDIAHRMKGSSRMVGAEAMAKACLAIEQSASNGDVPSAREASIVLDSEIQRVETYILGVKK